MSKFFLQNLQTLQRPGLWIVCSRSISRDRSAALEVAIIFLQ